MTIRVKKAHFLQLGRALSLVWEGTPGWTILSMVLVGLQAGLPLAQLYLTKLMVDAVTAGIVAPDKIIALDRVIYLVCLLGAAALASVFLASIAKMVGQAQADVITDHVQNILHAKSVELDLEYYESSFFYDALFRAQQEAPYRPPRIVAGLVQLSLSLVSLLGIAALLFSFHWGIAAVLFASLAPGILVRLNFAGRMYKWQRERSGAERAAGYLNWLLTGDYHAKEIRLFDLGALFISRFRDLRKQIRREKMGLTFKNALSDLVAQGCATAAVFGSLAFIAYRTVQGAMTIGDMVMYYQAFQRGQGFLKDLLSGMGSLYEDSLFLSNFYEFLALKPRVVEPRSPVAVPRPMKKGIVFEEVSFRYPTSTGLALDKVSLAIPPGQIVALVGENGSGKTTLVKMLCRLYDPTAGCITIDGTDLRNFESTALRCEIGIIFQDYAHYHMTARENIWVGNVKVPLEDEKIITAAKHSGAHGIVDELPGGYDTMLGKWFENGTELSIGEWQKVALARAFLRDAQIIVLDEPTSSLDAEAEHKVFSNFRQLAAGRTAILISHRLSNLRMADCIYVLKNGRIIEGGAHDELIRLGGTYARMFGTQARSYK